MFLISIFFSCKDTSQSKQVSDGSSDHSESFVWLLGNWERSNEQEGKKTFETWEKLSKSEYHGFGYTLENADTIWHENIKLINRENQWNFEVTGKDESLPTIFRITNIENESFISENQENEFPKLISYSRNGEYLNAVISGGKTEILFEFVTINGH